MRFYLLWIFQTPHKNVRKNVVVIKRNIARSDPLPWSLPPPYWKTRRPWGRGLRCFAKLAVGNSPVGLKKVTRKLEISLRICIPFHLYKKPLGENWVLAPWCWREKSQVWGRECIWLASACPKCPSEQLRILCINRTCHDLLGMNAPGTRIGLSERLSVHPNSVR